MIDVTRLDGQLEIDLALADFGSVSHHFVGLLTEHTSANALTWHIARIPTTRHGCELAPSGVESSTLGALKISKPVSSATHKAYALMTDLSSIYQHTTEGLT